MSETVPLCSHIKTDGVSCGSPAVSGTRLCYHHSAVRTALKAQSNSRPGNGGFTPIPFVFPEDRASMQINFFLLLQAFNEGRIDQRIYNCFLSLLRSMARNLGKTGSLAGEASDQRSAVSDQGKVAGEKAVSGEAVSKKPVSKIVAEGNGAVGGTRSLHASAKLPPEACYLKTVAAGADLFALGWMEEREARRAAGGRRAPLL